MQSTNPGRACRVRETGMLKTASCRMLRHNLRRRFTSFSLWFDGSCEVISVSCCKQVEIHWKVGLHAVITLMFCWYVYDMTLHVQ